MIHHRELKRTTNTGQLATKALANSHTCVRGEGREVLDLSPQLTSDYRSVLFYPADDAILLTPEWVAMDSRPIQLIVPDGNWRQASKVHYRHKELKDLPRVMLKSQASEETLYMRKESKPEGMATLEAIAHAFAVLEGPEVGAQLLRLYQLKLERTLKGRGQLKEKI